jgi:predicted nuclease with TOPRIM domain
MKQANMEESHKCDAILMERKQKEAETEEIERKIRELTQAEKEKLSHLPADLQRTYGELQDTSKRLIADESKLRSQYDHMCMQVHTYTHTHTLYSITLYDVYIIYTSTYTYANK